ncbi:MAG: hypothetical protein ACI4NF_02500 [Christensenellales bacterium]
MKKSRPTVKVFEATEPLPSLKHLAKKPERPPALPRRAKRHIFHGGGL